MALTEGQQVDEYARHLSEVNKKNRVLATEDILNNQGVLLVNKGTPINEHVADKIVKHKLLRPIENSVNLENVIDGGRLFKAFANLFKRFPDCEQLHQKHGFNHALQELCKDYGSYPLLTQKLTVLSMQRPHDFEKGLFCAWFAMAMAFKMKLTRQQVIDAFLAGLMHDTGMLHISREILDKKGALTPDEWRTIQSHTLIGDLFLKNVPGLSATVARATLEHHERRDGAGYPVGKFAEKLSQIGQIVAIADSICAIRILRLSGSGGNLANLLPIIQFNEGSYDPDCYKVMFGLIRSVGLTPGRILPDQEVPAAVRGLILAHRQLTRCFKPLDALLRMLPDDSKLREVRIALHQLQGCWHTVASSGLLDSGLLDWLEKLLAEINPDEFAEIEEISVMLKELHWQLIQVRKSLAMLKEVEIFQTAEPQQALAHALELQEGLDQVFKR